MQEYLGLTKAQYLGYSIGWGLMKPHKKSPATKKMVCDFVGLEGYYTFHELFSSLASAPSQTSPGRANRTSCSGPRRQSEHFKKALNSTLNPDFRLLFIVHTDGSETGLAGGFPVANLWREGAHGILHQKYVESRPHKSHLSKPAVSPMLLRFPASSQLSKNIHCQIEWDHFSFVRMKFIYMHIPALTVFQIY